MNGKITRLILPVGFTISLLAGLFLFVDGSANAGASNAPAQGVTVMGIYDPAAVQPVFDAFTLQTGIAVTYAYNADTADYLLSCAAISGCPDLALISTPGLMGDLLNQGALISLESIIPDFDTYYTSTWRTICSYRGDLYCVPFSVGTKSMVWYRPQAFAAIGASVPLTWTALLDLSDAFLANSLTPFSIGAESGAASGWPLSDWFENILLRVGGPQAQRRLVKHQIAWTDPIVVEAMQRFGDIIAREDYQYGGISGTLTTFFADAIQPVFASPYSATMHAGGFFMRSFIEESFPALAPFQDYDFFDFPAIDPAYGKPVMGGATFMILFLDDSETRMLAQYFAGPQAGEILVSHNSTFSPNQAVSLSSYPDALSRKMAQQLLDASDFVFDLDDQLPGELQQYIWSAMMDYAANPDQMMSILQGIEDQAVQYQGVNYALFLPLTIR